MPTVLVRSVLFRASTLLLDTNPQFVRWSAAELVEWMNEGQRAIAKYVPIAASRIDSIKLSPGTRQSIADINASNIIPGDGATPRDVHGLYLNDIIRNMGVDGKSPGAVVSVASRETIDAVDRMWHSQRVARGGAIQHFTFDPRAPKVFYVSPPAGSSTWVEANIIESPPDVPAPVDSTTYAIDGASTQTISIDDRWADDLLNYIVARAWMKDAEDAASASNVQLYSTLFTNSINAQVAVLTGQNPNLRVLPLTPDVPAAAS